MLKLVACYLFLALVGACLATGTRIEDAADPGAWLAKELGLIGVSSPVANFDRTSNGQTEDEQVLAELRALQPLEERMHQSMTMGQFQQARELNEELVGQLRPIAGQSGSLKARSKLYELEVHHSELLSKLNKYALAIREAHLLRETCRQLPGCQQEPLEQLIRVLKRDLDGVDDYMVLGLTPGASQPAIKSAFRRLCLLIHPDKISDDDQGLMSDVFLRIRNAYEALL